MSLRKSSRRRNGSSVGGIAEAECAAEVDARAFEGGFGFDQLVDGSNGHAASERNILDTGMGQKFQSNISW